jgi:hypothetical protein
MTPHDTRDPLLPPARHIEPLFSVGEVREVVENIYHGEDFPQLVGTTSRGPTGGRVPSWGNLITN